MIISITSLKGGVGKSTITQNLAVCFAHMGYNTCIVDADTNQSSLKWAGLRPENLPLIFVSGQASVDERGAIVSDTFEGEFRRSVENVRRVLEAAGSDLAHVVQTRNYVRDAGEVALFNQLYREYFSEPFPARTTITNCLPASLRYEIEVVAVRRPA